MTSKRIGLFLFWFGALYVFVGSWFVMWWVAPIWQSSPPEHFQGTIWALGGPVFTWIALSAPPGSLSTAVGALLLGHTATIRPWPFLIFVFGSVLIALSMLFPSTLGYYPILFGVFGGIIVAFFLASLWYWAKRRRTLDGAAKTAVWTAGG